MFSLVPRPYNDWVIAPEEKFVIAGMQGTRGIKEIRIGCNSGYQVLQ